MDSTLSVTERNAFQTRWKLYGLSLEAGLALRRRARQDLFFLSNSLLGHTLAEPHKEVCDFFIHKDPDAIDFYTFASNYSHVYTDGWGRQCVGSHNGLLWLMRSGLKSTIDICDNVQWIICFPDIRIRILTDMLGLAQTFVAGTKAHFTLSDDGGPRVMPNGKPSLFQILFPEFCDTLPSNYSGNTVPSWTTPARRNFKLLAPTIIAGSLEGGKTGSHCDVLKIDDAITPEVMGTGKSVPTNLKNINQRIAMTLNLCDYPGFTEFIGTPQHSLDYNSLLVEGERQRMAKHMPPKTRVLIRPAYVCKPGFEGKKPDELTKDDVTEWWPERMPFERVQEKWGEPEGRDTVATQQLLDVSLKRKVAFTREMLVKATIPWNRIPRDGMTAMAGDLAYSTKPRADYTVLGTAKLNQARIYVTSIKRGRYGPDVMPREIAMEMYLQRPDRIAIEDSPGAQWLHRDIMHDAAELGYTGPGVEWIGLGQGIYQRLELEADLVLRLLSTGRLLFSTAIAAIEDLYSELEVFPNPKHHDDILAMLNTLCRRFLTEAEIDLAEAHEQADAHPAEMESGLWHQRMHGYGPGSARQAEVFVEEPPPEPTGYGLLPPVLGDLPE